MVDARWYLTLKEFEYVSKTELEANPALQHSKETDAPSLARKHKVGLVLAASFVAAILIAFLPTI